MSAVAAGAEALGLLYREAAALDERRWDDWLELYTADCEFWMPMWETESVMTTDPQRQLSHIYYNSRGGLEDRLTRIRSGRSPASTPQARTTHMLGGALESVTEGGVIELATRWTCHVFAPVEKREHVFHGSALYGVVRIDDGGLRIARKKVMLMNDCIPSMLDIYCV